MIIYSAMAVHHFFKYNLTVLTFKLPKTRSVGV